MLKIPKFAKNTDNMLKNLDALVLDYNGVIFDPETGGTYDQANVLIEKAKEKGIKTYILSNSTASSEGFSKNLTNLGYEKGKDYEDIITAGETFRTALIKEPEILIKNGINFSRKKIYAIGHVFAAVLENTSFEITKDLKKLILHI